MARNVGYPKSKLHEGLLMFMRTNRRPLISLVVIEAALIALASLVLLALGPHGPERWYVLGALHTLLLVGLPGLIAAAYVAHHPRAIWLWRGAMGESNTGDVLKRARRKRLLWGYVDGVNMPDGDIDHLVVMRSGDLLAIDSKWHTDDLPRDRADADAVSARRASKRAELLLRSEHVGALKREAKARHREAQPAFRVAPVVVVWGEGARRIAPHTRYADVTFVAGNHLESWLKTLTGEPVDRGAARDILQRVTAFRDRPQRATPASAKVIVPGPHRARLPGRYGDLPSRDARP